MLKALRQNHITVSSSETEFIAAFDRYDHSTLCVKNLV